MEGRALGLLERGMGLRSRIMRTSGRTNPRLLGKYNIHHRSKIKRIRIKDGRREYVAPTQSALVRSLPASTPSAIRLALRNLTDRALEVCHLFLIRVRSRCVARRSATHAVTSRLLIYGGLQAPNPPSITA